MESREQSRTYGSRNINRTAMSSITEDQCTDSKDDSSSEHLIMSAIIGDVMYLHQAMQQPDKEEFIKAMVREIDTHEKRKHWKIGTRVCTITKTHYSPYTSMIAY